MSYLENFHHQILGEANENKLVFLHGLMGSAANWRAITPSFVEDFQILTFDQRGHGRSFQPDGPYTPEAYAEDLLRILDELQWGPIYLVGHSMGGRNALNFAFRYPERVVKLVIEDIGPSIQQANADKIAHLLSLVPTPFKNKTEAREFFQSGQFEAQLPNNPNAKALGQYFYSNIHEKADGTADWRFSKSAIMESVKAGHIKDRWSEVAQLKVPTLVIRGEHSEDLPKSDYERYSRENSLIQTVEITNSGHWVHFDQRERFVECLKGFFSGTGTN
ncbi:MAG: alpha/beta hydrolase [Bdellovibrionales bacterium]